MSWWEAFRRWRQRAKPATRSDSRDKSKRAARVRIAQDYEEWNQVQFDDVSDEAATRQLVIGLDFGTSYTKVAVGEVRVSYAVPFWPDGRKPSYLLPTVLYWDNDGSDTVHLSHARKAAGVRIDRLKIRLLDGDTSTEALAHNVAYLALVLRHVRGWIMTEHARTYRGNSLDWLVNVGLPTDTFFENELVPLYRDIIHAAWSISVEPGPVKMARARAAVIDAQADVTTAGALHPDKVSPFPELAAEVAGYLRSPMRRKDLHLLVDVGAGTLDVAMFNVHETEDEEPLLPVFAKSVSRHGTAYLMEARRERTGRSSDQDWSYQDPVPETVEMARWARIPETELQEADAEFARGVRQAVLEPVKETWNQKYPTSCRWEEGVPLIACGGGMASDFFEDVVERLVSTGKPFRFERLRYPKPENLEAPGATPEDIDRLNVAYGLSFDPFDIAQTWGPDHIEDDPRKTNHGAYGGPYIDKDMV